MGSRAQRGKHAALRQRRGKRPSIGVRGETVRPAAAATQEHFCFQTKSDQTIVWHRRRLDHTWLGRNLRGIYWWLAEMHKREAMRVTFATIRRTCRKALKDQPSKRDVRPRSWVALHKRGICEGSPAPRAAKRGHADGSEQPGRDHEGGNAGDVAAIRNAPLRENRASLPKSAIRNPQSNALTGIFVFRPTTAYEGVRRLCWPPGVGTS